MVLLGERGGGATEGTPLSATEVAVVEKGIGFGREEYRVGV